jgi:Lrp/AsnC family transcriptional regulator for asnA, asnC and gidA
MALEYSGVDAKMLSTELDEVDLNILSALQDHARTPYTKIAETLGVSDATIHLRVKKMEEQGLIEKYTIILNEEAMGKPVTTYVLIRVDPSTVEDVCRKLMELEDVYEVCEIHERYDILVKIRGRSLNEVRDIIINKIRSIPNILGSEAYTAYKTWKRDVGVRSEPGSPHRPTT